MEFLVCDMSLGIQMSGKYSDIPAFFIRVGEGGRNVEEAVTSLNNMSKDYQRIKHLVITRTSLVDPLECRTGITEFLTKAFKIRNDWTVTIETNGQFPPLNPTSREFYISLYSVEVSYVIGNYKPLFDIAMYSKDYRFLFNYTRLDAIPDIYKEMSKYVEPGDDCEFEVWMRRHPMKHTGIMTESEMTEIDLNNILDICYKNGWEFIGHPHTTDMDQI